MRAVFSHWSLPLLHNRNKVHGEHSFSLLTSSWALSVLYARRVFGNAHLVTDTEGKRLLVDELHLPFDSVSTILDSCQDFHPDLWAFGKIVAYAAQNQPFMHIDYDAFLLEKPAKKFLEAPVFAESSENFQDYTFYNPNIEYISSLGYRSWCFPHSLRHAFNCGIFGGSDLPFIQEYCRQASAMFHFLNDNRQELEKHEKFFRRFISIVPEQYLLAVLSQIRKTGCSLLLDNPAGSKPGYIHLKGAKGSALVLDRIRKRLEQEFPAYVLEMQYHSIVANPVNRRYMFS